MEGTGDDVPFSIPKNLNLRKIDNLSSFQRVISLTLLILFIVLINWLVGTSKISSFYNAILPHNQTFTELAFNNVDSLPSTIPSDNQVNFSFMIHNVEGKAVSYPFVITLENGNVYKTLDSGKVTLKSNGAVNIPENLSIQGTSQRQEVVITLSNLKQSIDFWLKGSN